MTRIAKLLSLLILPMIFPIAGCSDHKHATNDHVVFLLPGVAGGSYANLQTAIESSSGATVHRVSWGAPPPLFMLNFSNQRIHDEAEGKLAKVIVDWRKQHPAGRIDLVGHSAGCGVVLGALRQLPPGNDVHNVVLLAPSVSPTYDLRTALEKIAGQLHVFSSAHDTFFLKWRTSHFGTYDNLKTIAAGNCGFDLSALPADQRNKVALHIYDESWRKLGNDGGHFGTLSKPFAEKIIAPIFAASQSDASPSQ